MRSSYRKLLSLASEVNVASTPEKIEELNSLLSSQEVDHIEDQHLPLMDDLICILSNTGNINPVNHDAITAVQELIRDRLSQSN